MRNLGYVIAAFVIGGATLVAASTFDWITVIDGDTVYVDIEGREDGAIRLVGYNAPEIGRARCDAERELGLKAKARLQEIIDKGGFTLAEVDCACPPGTEGTMRCNWSQRCGVLSLNDGNDTNVGDILIGEGLAVVFHCGTYGCPPTPKPWCD